MYDVDMILVQVKDGFVKIQDMCEERVAPISDFDYSGGTLDLVLIESSLENGVLTAQLSRALNTLDPKDFVLEVNMETDLCFSYLAGDNFEYHGQDYGSGKNSFRHRAEKFEI